MRYLRNPLTQYPIRTALCLSAILGVVLLLVITPAPAARAPMSLAALPPLAIGDWVFRAGTSAESQLIQKLSDSEFSHIGMVVRVYPEPLIAHATTDDDPQRSDQVLTSTLAEFTAPQLAQSFAIARPLFISTAEHTLAAQRVLEQLQQPFVLAERHSAHLYCTTLLADALDHTAIAFTPQWQQVNAPFFSGEYLFPHAFAHHPDIEWLYHSNNIQ